MGADHAAPPPLANAKSAFTRSWRRINLDFRCRTSPQEVGLLAYGRPASRPTSKMLRPWTRFKKTSPPWMATSARVVTAETPAMLAGAAPSRLRRPRNSERAVAGRRGGGATPAHCGWFAMAQSNVAGFEYQYGAEHRVASPPRPPSWSRWYAPPDVVLP